MRAGRVPPDALVRFEAVTQGAFVRAADLELYRSLRSEATLAYQGRFASSPPPIATALLVGVQIRIWWMAKLPGVAAPMVALGTKWSPYILEDGEVWRLLTMGLLHTDFLHITMNMLWMSYAGWSLERALGWKNLVVLYFASVVGGSLMSTLFAAYTPSLGASGGVFGLIAAAVVFGFVRTDILPPEGRRWFGWAMLPYLVVMFWSGWSNPSTDNWSHFGGLITGLGLGLVVDPDEIERRPGFSRTIRWSIGAITAALLVGLALLGPRIEPILDSDAARIAARPTDPRRPAPAQPPSSLSAGRARRPDPPRKVAWGVPAGWRPGTAAARFPAFVGPQDAGEGRAFGVRLADRSRPPDLQQAARDFVDRLVRDWPQAEAEDPAPATLAGRPGIRVRVRFGHPGDERIAVWSAARRGVWLLEALWQVEEAREARLAPLRARLEANIAWPDPPELTAARTEAIATPKSVRVRRDLARALARAGESEEARAIHDQLLSERPDDPDTWVAALEGIAILGEDAGDASALFDRALSASPDPATTVAVANALDATGRAEEAQGLLVIAWNQAPGERAIKRAMIRRDLPTALDPATRQPWTLVFGPTGAPRDPEGAARRRAWPRTLAGASLAADALAADRRAATVAAVATIEAGASEAIAPLLVLRDGHVATDLTEATPLLADELRRALAGTPPDWMPDEVRGALAENPGFPDAVASPPPPAPNPAPGP